MAAEDAAFEAAMAERFAASEVAAAKEDERLHKYLEKIVGAAASTARHSASGGAEVLERYV